ncbi:hypothetical protein BN136_2641 [Cronobacter universalis NCTC 9529]|nr:hypothetical protein BN136_2641 [Cronobacter universalis NCTC 9529]
MLTIRYDYFSAAGGQRAFFPLDGVRKLLRFLIHLSFSLKSSAKGVVNS